MKELTFKKSSKAKQKDKLLSVFLVTLLLIALYIAYNDNSKASLIILSLMLIGGVSFLYKSWSNKNTVIVNNQGIYNQTNGMGLIEWEYITSFEISKLRNAEVLIVKINDSNKLLSGKNAITRQLMKSNINKLGSPIVIMGSEFNQELGWVKKELEKRLDDIKGR